MRRHFRLGEWNVHSRSIKFSYLPIAAAAAAAALAATASLAPATLASALSYG